MAVHAAPVAKRRAVQWTDVLDAATYWAGIAATYVSYGFLWYYAAKEKLFDQNGDMPAGLAKAYKGTVIDNFPGINASWLLLGLLEGAAFLVIVASLVSGEFMPTRRKPILLAGLTVSMFTFAVMTFGQNVIGNFEGVASLFTYMGVTGVVYAVIRYWLPARQKQS
jgi:large-conductance mechanosensitive channel